METKETSSDKATVPKRFQKHTKKITAILCTDVASATFVRLLKTASLSAFNTFGVSFQNQSESIVSSVLNLFQNLIQEL